MLCFSQQNPNKPANQEIYGTFNFNATPLAPPGTKSLIYDDLAAQTSWAPHATGGLYVDPASDHYQCLQFYIPATQRFRFSGMWHLYPTHCQIPISLQQDFSITVAADLLKALSDNLPTSTLRRSGMSVPHANSWLSCSSNDQPPHHQFCQF
jgi:hypothetical protein